MTENKKLQKREVTKETKVLVEFSDRGVTNPNHNIIILKNLSRHKRKHECIDYKYWPKYFQVYTSTNNRTFSQNRFTSMEELTNVLKHSKHYNAWNYKCAENDCLV
jgi:hypothetical protein